MINLLKRKKTFLSISLILTCFTFILSGCTPNPTEPMLWINGTYAVLTKINENDITVFAGRDKNVLTSEASKMVLESDWGITNREELDATIDELQNGMHNTMFLEEYKYNELDQLTKEDFELLLTYLESPEDVEYFKLAYDTYTKFGDNAIMGWDLSRAVSLCGFGYVADYYTYDEAIAKATDISKQIQSTFDSWDSFYESYMFGYEYWSDEAILDETSLYNQRLAIIETFKNDPTSFYHLDWNLDLDSTK